MIHKFIFAKHIEQSLALSKYNVNAYEKYTYGFQKEPAPRSPGPWCNLSLLECLRTSILLVTISCGWVE